jgi:8-oxo-dGTP pyrophosphatase MutT (NUDIX family)
MKEKIRRAVFIVTYAKTSKGVIYLLLKRKLHWKGWEFPKGGVNFFETKKHAAKRELKEETGLSPIKFNSFKEKGVYLYKKKLPDRLKYSGQNYKLYSAEVKFSKKIKLEKIEHSSFIWTDFKTAIKKLTWSNQKKCLRIVNEWIKKSN